jgi:polysaccharide export outer membrane protein
MRFLWLGCALFLAGCGVVYHSSSVTEGPDPNGSKVRVVPLTPETVLAANRSTYIPKQLPAVFFRSAGARGAMQVSSPEPEPSYLPETRPASLQTRIPPTQPQQSYRIGIEDQLLLATPTTSSSVEQLSGLLAAESKRQGYRVQDDGSISIPDVGRVQVAGKSLEDAENAIFNALVEAGLNPSFSLEVAEFKSQKASVGGAVRSPIVVPITLSPLLLNQAINAAGGFDLTDQDYASVRIYRDGTLYQIPVKEYFRRGSLQNIALKDGDSVFVDTDYELDKASAYFAQQIQLSTYRQSVRSNQLSHLTTEVGLRRSELGEQRDNFEDRLTYDAVDRDYVYLVGEVSEQARYSLPFGQKATLADALYSESSGFANRTGNPRQIYVLRGSPNPAEFGGVTAWNLDATNAANFILATRMELRPNDVIFIASQPITRWNRVLTQMGPGLVNSSVAGIVN